MMVEINTRVERAKKIKQIVKHINHAKVAEEIQKDDTFKLHAQDTITYDKFISKLKTHIENNTTITNKREIVQSKKPWVDAELVQSIETRHFWHTKLEDDKENIDIL